MEGKIHFARADSRDGRRLSAETVRRTPEISFFVHSAISRPAVR